MFTEEHQRYFRGLEVPDLERSRDVVLRTIATHSAVVKEQEERLKFLNELITNKRKPKKGDIVRPKNAPSARRVFLGGPDDPIALAVFRARHPDLRIYESTDAILFDPAGYVYQGRLVEYEKVD